MLLYLSNADSHIQYFTLLAVISHYNEHNCEHSIAIKSSKIQLDQPYEI